MSSPALPQLDEFRSATLLYRTGDKFNPPALTNFYGCLQAAPDILAVQHLTFPPYSTGESWLGALTLNGCCLHTSGQPIEFRWRPDRIERAMQHGGVHLSSTTVKRWIARVIVLTQACDLVQAKADRVLVARVHQAQQLVDQGLLKAGAIRDQVRRHQVFGWYFLAASTAPVVIPESLIDLRDLHSVPRVVLEQLIAGGKRDASLASPYREHLAQHFAVTYMRVALPEPYSSQP